MTVRQTQRVVSSAEFTAWIAFYAVEAEMQSGVERDPTPEGLRAKLHALADIQNARGR